MEAAQRLVAGCTAGREGAADGGGESILGESLLTTGYRVAYCMVAALFEYVADKLWIVLPFVLLSALVSHLKRHTSTHSKDQPTTIAKLLAAQGLSKYERAFASDGFELTEDVRRLSEQELIENIGMKKGHAAALKVALSGTVQPAKRSGVMHTVSDMIVRWCRFDGHWWVVQQWFLFVQSYALYFAICFLERQLAHSFCDCRIVLTYFYYELFTDVPIALTDPIAFANVPGGRNPFETAVREMECVQRITGASGHP
jgi:hypothetical protein